MSGIRRVLLRRDTALNWSGINPVLQQGEIGVELGTDGNRLKCGDGFLKLERIRICRRHRS